jgi:hypothetical protein
MIGKNMLSLEEVQLICAEASHEMNRIYCAALGDNTQVPWKDAPEWQRISALKGVIGVAAGNDPQKSHESWLAEKEATGWKYAPVKNIETKEHPCFVPYDQLSSENKQKDYIYVSTVRAMSAALGYPLPLPNT